MNINYVEHSDGTKLFSFTRHDFKEYKKDGEYIQTFNSIKEALISLNKNVKSGHITSCCKNKRKIAYGYKWRYKK